MTSPFSLSRADRFRTPAGIRRIVHDDRNLRLKLYGLRSSAELSSAAAVIDESSARGVSKLIVYARPGDAEGWRRAGLLHEGTIRRYFADGGDAEIWSRFSTKERRRTADTEAQDRTVEIARALEATAPELAEGYRCEIATREDAHTIAILMKKVFSPYPETIDAESIAAAIAEGEKHFRVVRDAGGRIVASASAEIDSRNRSAELTDCATDPQARGRGLMRFILRALEIDLRERFRITDLYTLARADEPAMNCAFAKLGYDYTGRLVNNCRMPNGWESMNIWCRRGDD
jgi:beta-lysine N6-acetyltransferase